MGETPLDYDGFAKVFEEKESPEGALPKSEPGFAPWGGLCYCQVTSLHQNQRPDSLPNMRKKQ